MRKEAKSLSLLPSSLPSRIEQRASDAAADEGAIIVLESFNSKRRRRRRRKKRPLALRDNTSAIWIPFYARREGMMMGWEWNANKETKTSHSGRGVLPKARNK